MLLWQRRDLAIQVELGISQQRVDRIVDEPVQLQPIIVLDAHRLLMQVGAQLVDQRQVEKQRIFVEVPPRAVDRVRDVFVLVDLVSALPQ